MASSPLTFDQSWCGDPFWWRKVRIRRALLRCRGAARLPSGTALGESTPLVTASIAPALDAAAVLILPPPFDAGEADAQIRTPEAEGSCFDEVSGWCGEDILRALASVWGRSARGWPDLTTIGELRAILTAAGLSTYPIPEL